MTNPTTPIKILHIDDHPAARRALKIIVEQFLGDGFELIGQAAGGEQGIEMALRLKPDVVLLDISMPPGIDGNRTAGSIFEGWPEAKILHYTGNWSGTLARSLAAGKVAGYCYKICSDEELANAIRAAHAGESGIRPAEDAGRAPSAIEPSVEPQASEAPSHKKTTPTATTQSPPPAEKPETRPNPAGGWLAKVWSRLKAAVPRKPDRRL
ncbi:response regulator [Gloeobacter morelensis]|uniref:response regulator n=1 Tax=Gloeobacter morelensis TaxID=2907343 RepID=UPI001E32BFED|nr:response regulator transcription factor [Gloeobacter morelensis]UFP97165.1 response regulator [Gloeobacter morelensis MG652769]